MNKEILNSLFSFQSLVKHQIDSFNNFVKYDIQKIINDVGDVIFEKENDVYKIEFGKISIMQPQHIETNGQKNLLFPHEARLRNLTYCSVLNLDVNLSKNNEIFETTTCELGKLPIMVKSLYCNLHYNYDNKECKHDLGGYFIVSGNEKVLISQEKMNNNRT